MESAGVVARKIRLIVQREGLRGALRVARQKYRYAAEFTPARRRARREVSDFDRAHGVSTSAIVDPSELTVEGPSAAFGYRHQPSPPERFVEIIRSLPIRFEDFVFVDLGSGLGRALLLAAEFPFQRVVGVELSPELERTAQENLRRVTGRRPGCARVESILGDAATFALPDTPLVVYLYNPFDAPIVAAVVRNVEASLQSRPRPLFVIYYYPKFREILDGSAALQAVQRCDEFAIYTAAPASVSWHQVCGAECHRDC